MALAARAELVDRDVVADAGDDVLQDAVAGLMEEHVIGDNRRDAHPRCQIGELKEPELIVRSAAQGQCHIGAIAEGVPQAA
jgi:hypothetical protein